LSQSSAAGIPQEIHSFFTNPGGHSLILRGMAGAGKTTFALQTIEDLVAAESSFYFSTRVSDESLLLQFPWLRDKLASDVTSRIDGQKAEGTHQGLSALKGINTAPRPSGKGLVSVSIGKDLGEIEDMYTAVERRAPERTLVVVDSIDALAERYGLACIKLINTLQKDLVEGLGANMVYVIESPEQMLDYLGDGVIRLTLDEHQGRRTRVIEILKLRGCEIRQPKYLYTLKGGRIQSFEYRWERAAGSNGQWRPVPDAGDILSTGIKDLDQLLGGGLGRGSIVLIEMGRGVPTPVASIFEDALVANFVSLNRGVIWMPLRKASAEGVRSRLADALPKDRFDRQVRVPELASTMDITGGQFVLPVEGASAAADLKWQNISYHLQGAEQPYLTLIGFDSAESIYGAQVMDQLTDLLAAVKRNRSLFVGITSQSNASIERLKDLATTHLKLDRVGGTALLYGEEPYTECYAITFQENDQGGQIALTPIV